MKNVQKRLSKDGMYGNKDKEAFHVSYCQQFIKRLFTYICCTFIDVIVCSALTKVLPKYTTINYTLHKILMNFLSFYHKAIMEKQNIPQMVTHSLYHIFLSTCRPFIFVYTAVWHQDSITV